MTDENQAEESQETSLGSLNDAFSDESKETAEVEVKPTKTQKSEPESKGDTEEAEVEETEEESDTETPSEKETEGKSVPVAALKSERQKRQSAELERDELRKRVAQAGNVESAEEPDIDQKLFNERTNLSREIMMEAKPDYQEMENIFIDIAKKDDALINGMRKSVNPAKFAYTKAKEHLEYQDYLKIKDSEEYKGFLDAKKSGKLEKAVEETPQQKRKTLALSVPNLNKATAVSSNSNKVEKTVTLNELFD